MGLRQYAAGVAVVLTLGVTACTAEPPKAQASPLSVAPTVEPRLTSSPSPTLRLPPLAALPQLPPGCSYVSGPTVVTGTYGYDIACDSTMTGIRDKIAAGFQAQGWRFCYAAAGKILLSRDQWGVQLRDRGDPTSTVPIFFEPFGGC